jgi:transcriptional regulator with XRE-family HTH domain
MTEPVLPPPLLRLQLAERLIDLRRNAGLTQEQARKKTGLARSTIIDIERAETANIRISTLVSLLNAYGVSGDEQVELIRMAEQAKPDSHYLEYRDVAPNFAKNFFEREAYATEIWLFQSGHIPGLFQLPYYVRAITRARHPERSDEEIERSVQLRDVRQSQVLGTNKPRIRAILDEAALLRGVTQEQLDHLIAVSELPFVDLRIVPLSLGVHAAMGASFDVLFYESAPNLDVLFLEDLVGADYHERDSQLFAEYVTIFERLAGQCLSAGKSRDVLVTLRGASGAN